MLPTEVKEFKNYPKEYVDKIINVQNYFKKEFDLEAYSVYGTLLSTVREGKFIEYDNDIDMTYMSKYHSVGQVIMEYRWLLSELTKRDLLIRHMDGHFHIWEPFKRTNIDFWTSWIGLDNNYYLIPLVTKPIGAENILPFKYMKLEGIDIKVPNNPELLLEEWYEDWRTPVKDGKPKHDRFFI